MNTDEQRDSLEALEVATGKITLAKIAMDSAIEENGSVAFPIANAVLEAIKEAESIIDNEVFKHLAKHWGAISPLFNGSGKTA